MRESINECISRWLYFHVSGVLDLWICILGSLDLGTWGLVDFFHGSNIGQVEGRSDMTNTMCEWVHLPNGWIQGCFVFRFVEQNICECVGSVLIFFDFWTFAFGDVGIWGIWDTPLRPSQPPSPHPTPAQSNQQINVNGGCEEHQLLCANWDQNFSPQKRN